MKAIETSYDGYLFRSRLEARWAIFFNKLGIKYEYEKEGYDLGNSIKYLPDFWLLNVCLRNTNELGIWLEIKGRRPTYDESVACFALGKFTKQPVLLAIGLPNEEIFQEYPPWETDMFFYKCYGCGSMKIVSTGSNSFYCPKCNENFDSQHPDICYAMEASKYARFEHGQSG